MKEWKHLFWLFWVNICISAFTFGGGYVVMVMIRKYYVEGKGCFDEEELLKIAAIAQSSPGAIAVNMSALAGYRVAGFKGLLISCIASIIPPLCILAVISNMYDVFAQQETIQIIMRGMEAGVTALIVSLLFDMYQMLYKEHVPFYLCMAIIVCFLHTVCHISLIPILMISVLLSLMRGWQMHKGGQEHA